MITKDLLHKLFVYKDGNLIWINPISKKAKVGNIAGNINKKVRSIGIYNKNYAAHRLIFMYHYGFMPKIIDHIDGNPYNNNIENLREATNIQNAQNSKKSISNSSGYKNVSWNKERQKWKVRIMIKSKEINFGAYEDVELADLVAQEVRDKYFGKFARHC